MAKENKKKEDEEKPNFPETKEWLDPKKNPQQTSEETITDNTPEYE